MQEASSSQGAAPGPAVFLGSALVLGWVAREDLAFGDAGELGTAAHVLGVPHPTGFPLDMLLLRAAEFIPLGHIAWRQNLCTALVSAAVLALLAHGTAMAARRAGVTEASSADAAAVLVAASLAAWMTFLRSAVAVEVYSTALLLTALGATSVLRGGRTAGLALVLVGLSIGAHVTAGLALVLVSCAALIARPAGRRLRFLGARLPVALALASIVLYLPLASLRDPPIDWGNPETFGALLAHLSAARIRSAYHDVMLGQDAAAAGRVLGQLAELAPLLLAALIAMVSLRGRGRGVLLTLWVLAVADLAYAVWVNPMGAGERQVGHLAGASLAVLGGIGVASALHWARQRAGARWGAACVGLVALLTVFVVLRTPRSVFADGHVLSELHGSGGSLAALPTRAVLLCSDDSRCSAALFALHVERVRPDVSVAPAQHLWDPTVLRGLRPLPAVEPFMDEPSAAARSKRQGRVLSALARAATTRPLLWESVEALSRPGQRPRASLSAHVPYLTLGGAHAPVVSTAGAMAELERLAKARPALVSADARRAWAGAFATVGAAALGADDAAGSVAAFRRAVDLAPTRASGWSNLGAALQAHGALAQADEATRRSIEIDPAHRTGWVNLIRFALNRGELDRGRRLLAMARDAGVSDPRLDALRQQVGD